MTFPPEGNSYRAAMGALSVALFALTAASLVYFVSLSVKLHRIKPKDLNWRGIIKLASLRGVPATMSGIYTRWFRAFWAFYLVGCLAVATAVWGTDHSFLVVIFPLLFYYFFARYFLWEKADLSD